jgi:hypothetical protein
MIIIYIQGFAYDQILDLASRPIQGCSRKTAVGGQVGLYRVGFLSPWSVLLQPILPMRMAFYLGLTILQVTIVMRTEPHNGRGLGFS